MTPLNRGILGGLVLALFLAAFIGGCHGYRRHRTPRQSSSFSVGTFSYLPAPVCLPYMLLTYLSFHPSIITSNYGVFPGSGPVCAAGSDCVSLRSCPALNALLQRPSPDNLRRLQQAICGFNRRDPRVCCPSAGPTPPTPPTQPTPPTPPTVPTPPTQPTPPSTGSGEALLPPKCGEPASIQTRIFFGENAPLGAYPWMALIGFTSSAASNVVWGCGGALINSRYVLTAGHCTAPQFTFDRQLSLIRLGEHNIASNEDCENTQSGRICAPTHQDFTPEEIIRHPTFNTRGTVGDDIALIRLNRPAEINGFVQPVCLPPPGTTVTSIIGSRQPVVAGWGSTENGPNTQILQSVRLPFVGKDQCNPFYRNNLIEEQICFGGDGQRDSCFGDSGGPVMISGTTSPTYTIVGIVSFGQPRCGVEGTPAVYTDVTAYRSWIINNLKA